MYLHQIIEKVKKYITVPSDFTAAISEIGRDFVNDENDDKGEKVKFLINGVLISISESDKEKLDNSSTEESKDDIIIEAYLNNKKTRINIGKHEGPEKNWNRFINNLLDDTRFKLNTPKKKENVVNILKTHNQKRYGIFFDERTEEAMLMAPIASNSAIVMLLSPVFPKIRKISINVDPLTEKATLKRNQSYSVTIPKSNMLDKFLKKEENKDEEIEKILEKNKTADYLLKFSHLEFSEDDRLKNFDKENIEYENPSVKNSSPFMLEYFNNRNFLEEKLFLKDSNIKQKKLEEIKPDLQSIQDELDSEKAERLNKEREKTEVDDNRAKKFVQEMRLVCGLAILNYDAKLREEITEDTNLSKEEKQPLLKALEIYTKQALKELEHLYHPNDINDFLKKTIELKERLDKFKNLQNSKNELKDHLNSCEKKSESNSNKTKNKIIKNNLLDYHNTLCRNILKADKMKSYYELKIKASNNHENKKLYQKKAEEFEDLSKSLEKERSELVSNTYNLIPIKISSEENSAKNNIEEEKLIELRSKQLKSLEEFISLKEKKLENLKTRKNRRLVTRIFTNIYKWGKTAYDKAFLGRNTAIITNSQDKANEIFTDIQDQQYKLYTSLNLLKQKENQTSTDIQKNLDSPNSSNYTSSNKCGKLFEAVPSPSHSSNLAAGFSQVMSF